jgi:hypothetical protein
MTEGIDNAENRQNEDVPKLKQFYVYELINPTNQQVFYVGKGQGNRAKEHLKVSADTESNPEKSAFIDQIRSNNLEPIVRVIGRFELEEQAFSVEATLIHWVYGIDSLTNIQSGHGSSTIRNLNDHRELEGIDIPRTTARWDGEYTKALREARELHSIIPLIRSLRDYLREEIDLEFSEPDVRKSDRTRIYADIGVGEIRLGAFHSETPAIILRLELGNKEPEVFEDFCNQAGLEFTSKKPPYRIAKLIGFDRSKEFSVVLEKCKRLANLANAYRDNLSRRV